MMARPAAAAALPAASNPRPSQAYKQQSIALLRNVFPVVSVASISRTFSHHKSSFTAAYNTCRNIQALATDDEPDQDAVKQRLLELHPLLELNARILIKNSRQMTNTPPPSEPTLLEEIAAIPELNQKENRCPRGAIRQREKAEKQEETLECECCYSDSPVSKILQCCDGHLFCFHCISMHVNAQLHDKNTSDVPCMMMSENGNVCTAGFSFTELKRALPDEEFENWSKRETEESIVKANMADIWTCPECRHMACDDASQDPVVTCPNCRHESCQLCKKASHVPKTCEEAAAEDSRANAVARAADAMTKAVIRECPKCKSPFVKKDGCNKITCPKCDTKSCYQCRKEISDYNHFCRTAHCQHKTCGKCILYTNTEEDDRRARREAGMKEQENAGESAEEVARLFTPPRKAGPANKKQRRQAPVVDQRAANGPAALPPPRVAAAPPLAPPRAAAAPPPAAPAQEPANRAWPCIIQ